jgi:hypothetical protein
MSQPKTTTKTTGRPSKFKGGSTTICLRVPTAHVAALRAQFYKIINQYAKPPKI